MSQPLQMLLVWLLLVASECSGANILAIFVDPSKSHMIAYQPLTRALAAKGHNVTVVSYHPQDKPLENYTDIHVPLKWFGLDSHLKSILNPELEQEVQSSSDQPSSNKDFELCRHFLETPGVQQLIHSSSPHFDLLILELHLPECFLGFAHKYNCNIVGIYVHGGKPSQYEYAGNIYPLSYAPHINHLFTDHMSLFERTKNVFFVVWEKLWSVCNKEMYDNITMQYFNKFSPLPSTTELMKRISLVFFNNDVSLNTPKPLLPTVMDIAGMHINPPQKLDRELQKFLDESSNGVVLFSMGSHTGDFLKSEEKTRVFLDAFSELNQTVLWKSSPLTGVPPNVKLMDWLPQADVMAHPKVLVYLTHGGLLGIEEAVYNAKPIVGIPIHADQLFNTRRAQDVGYGIQLHYHNLTKERLLWALNTVILDPRYQETAQVVSARFRDQPVSPLKKAVFWTEYLLKHPNDRRFRPTVRDLLWYEELLMDVIAVLLLSVIFTVCMLYLVLKKLLITVSLSIFTVVIRKKKLQ